MTISEKRQQIDETIAALEKVRDKAPFKEWPNFDDAIGKLIANKELISTSGWDNFKSNITDDDFRILKEAKMAIDDERMAEQTRIAKLDKGFAIGKKIFGIIKKL